MGARQHADFRHDRANRLGVAAIDAQAGIQDVVTDDIGLKLLEQPLGLIGIQPFGGQRLGGLFLGRGNLLLANLLYGFGIGGADAVTGQRVDAAGQRLAAPRRLPAAATGPWPNARPGR